jgi:hypothetical protein
MIAKQNRYLFSVIIAVDKEFWAPCQILAKGPWVFQKNFKMN